MSRRLAAWVATLSLGLASPPTWGEDPAPAPALPAALRSEPGVKDPVFSILIGLLASDSYGVLTRERLESELARQSSRTRLPYKRLRELSRTPGETAGTAVATLCFDRAFDEPIPYRILGYHPGSILASPTCVLREWLLGTLDLGGVRVEDVHLLAVAEGRMRADIDGWLDFLMGPALDDTEVTGFAVLRRNGRWLGLALGRNAKGGRRLGTFDFAQDRIVFPAPGDMRTVANALRARLESLTMPPGRVLHETPR